MKEKSIDVQYHYNHESMSKFLLLLVASYAQKVFQHESALSWILLRLLCWGIGQRKRAC